MDLAPYIDDIRRHLIVAAEAGGDDARALAERLVAPLDSAVQLAIQNALAAAADEITVELAPGSVELRVRGGELGFVVTPAPVDPLADATDDLSDAPVVDSTVGDDTGEMARINVRMPESLKARIEHAAGAQRVSVNAWLVRAAGAALDRGESPPSFASRSARRPQRYTGWAK